MTVPVSPWAALPSAVRDESFAERVLHFGQPSLEQRRLASGTAVVERADTRVFTLTGPDRLTWLNSITSQSLTGLRPGDSAETLILDVQGHVEHQLRILDDGVTAWLLVDDERADAAQAWLDKMRFMSRVELVDVSSDFSLFGALGSGSAREALASVAAAPNGVPVLWQDSWDVVAPGGFGYSTADRPAAWDYVEVVVPRSTVPVLVSRVDEGTISAAGLQAFHALRIEAWRPSLADADERSLPHELDWLRSAVHLSKGCYRGQETVAKVHNLGHPPRRLVFLHLDGSDSVLPPAGSAVLGEREGVERVVGTVTSSAWHHELGPIALATVKRVVPTDLVLSVQVGAEPGEGGAPQSSEQRVSAAQEVIVPTDAGAEANVARLPRLGAR